MAKEFEAVIGLEVHVQLKTQSRMFTRAPYSYGGEPNTQIDPVVLGLPGALPVLNRAAIHQTLQLGLMFGCTLATLAKWDRKHYFYPDCPKNYQISQHTHPLCSGGTVEIELPGPARNLMGQHRTVRLNRIHLEEDVGKLIHSGYDSLVDFNRAGAALIEIVTEPDIYSAEEAFAFLTSLKIHLLYLGISDCDMEKGQLRCDANISLRPKGSSTLGTKVELKNLNSISGVRNGIAYEINRQSQVLLEGQAVVQETKRWDLATGVSSTMRSKEKAQDYRYFPDPDLLPVKVTDELKASLAKTIPELPFAKQERFLKQYELPYTITSVLCPSNELSNYFEEALRHHYSPKAIANLIVNDLLRELSTPSDNGGSQLTLATCKLTPQALAELVKVTEAGTISKQVAQTLLIELCKTGEAVNALIQRQGLGQACDTDKLKHYCQEAIQHNPKAVQEFKSGKDNAINALKGFVMKQTQGTASPQLVDTLLRELL